MTTAANNPVDLVGVGFGAANLSLAALFDSSPYRDQHELVCLERGADFAWHSNMLIDGARMQVAFLKDLVTPVDPTSPYSFVNYLCRHGRLEDFANLRSFYPTRFEFHDYLCWAAAQLSAYARYGSSVEGLRPIKDEDGVIRRLEVVSRGTDGHAETTLETRNVVLALGGRPSFPRSVEDAPPEAPVFHSASFLSRLAKFEAEEPVGRRSFLVVGAGQSAGEIFHHLARRHPDAEVTLAFRGFALMPANSSPHANEIFNPEIVDLFYAMPPSARTAVLEQLHHTNYSAVDDDDIYDIVSMLYEQKVAGGDRLNVRRFTELESVGEEGGAAVARLRDLHSGATTEKRYDAIFCATGYEFAHAHDMLGDLEPYVARTDGGGFAIGRDYSLVTDPRMEARIFLQGPTEGTHGIASTLFSVMARRSQEILDAAFGAAPDTGAKTGNGPVMELAINGQEG